MATRSLAQWFCLKEGRSNFQIRPERDQHFMFGNKKWRQDIQRELQRGLLLGNPVRLVWWGDYGIGKTQRLRFMEHLINTDFKDEKPTYFPVVVTTRDLQDKSGFEQLHYELVNRLNFESMRNAVVSYARKLHFKEAGPIPYPQLTTSEDVINAFRVLGSDNPRFAEIAWRFLTGQAIPRSSLDAANVHKEQLDSSVEFADTLKVFATIVEVEWGKQLFYMVDQVEALSKITNKNAEARWVETLRAVLDITNLGLVLAIGGSRLDGLPTIVQAPEIVRRFTVDKYIQMPAYETQDAEEFVKDLLDNLIDPAKRLALEKTQDWEATQPGYLPAYYPFAAEGAYRKFCRWFGDQPKFGKPTEIIAKLDYLAAEAFLIEKHLFDETFLMDHGINA